MNRYSDNAKLVTFDNFCNHVQAELRRLKQKDTFTAREADELFQLWRKDSSPEYACELICNARVLAAFAEVA